jgi:hypothetical protein
MPMVIDVAARPDLQQLRHHCSQCIAARGRLHLWRCAVEAVNAFVAPRIISALVVVAALVLIGVSLPLHA